VVTDQLLTPANTVITWDTAAWSF